MWEIGGMGVIFLNFLLRVSFKGLYVDKTTDECLQSQPGVLEHSGQREQQGWSWQQYAPASRTFLNVLCACNNKRIQPARDVGIPAEIARVDVEDPWKLRKYISLYAAEDLLTTQNKFLP